MCLTILNSIVSWNCGSSKLLGRIGQAFDSSVCESGNLLGLVRQSLPFHSVVFYLYRGQCKSVHLFTAMWRISVYFHKFSKDRLSFPVYGE